MYRRSSWIWTTWKCICKFSLMFEKILYSLISSQSKEKHFCERMPLCRCAWYYLELEVTPRLRTVGFDSTRDLRWHMYEENLTGWPRELSAVSEIARSFRKANGSTSEKWLCPGPWRDYKAFHCWIVHFCVMLSSQTSVDEPQIALLIKTVEKRR